MILYINGDAHAAAANAVLNVCSAEEDIDLWWMGGVPHPENLSASFGAYISKVLKARLIVEAKYNQTNQNIIDSTNHFIQNNPIKEDLVIIIGFPENNFDQMSEFGKQLKAQDIKHILYPTEDYVKWLKDRKFEADEFGYFGKDAHRAWAGNLIKPLTRIL
jgi:hypothetical protein